MICGFLTGLPWGCFAGSPAIALDVDGRDGFTPEAGPSLARALGQAQEQYPGASIVLIRSAPWSDPDWAMVLDVGCADTTSLYATQPIGAPSWGFRDLVWLADATALVETAQNAEGVERAIRALAGFPAPHELLARPAPSMVTPQVLDALAQNCGGQQTMCQLVVEPADYDRALYAIAKAESVWRLGQVLQFTDFPLFTVA